MRFEYRDGEAAAGERSRGAKTGDAAADHCHLDAGWHGHGIDRRHGERVTPVRSLLKVSRYVGHA